MSEMKQILVDTASRLFSDHCTRELGEAAERGVWPETLWKALEAAGLSMAAVSETRGGAGAEFADMLALIRVAGFFSAPVPLAETFLAEQMLAAANLPPHAGPLTVGPVICGDRLTLTQRDGSAKLSGILHHLPWARNAAAIVVLADSKDGITTAVVERPHVGTEGWNYAREPRDTLRFDDYLLPETAIGTGGKSIARDDLFARGALFRAIAMAGALEKVLELTVAYAKERVQFGRPIGKFQAVQQQIAVLATHVAASRAAVEAAIDAAARGPAFFEIAAAKARVGEAAGIAAGIAHQVHGAIGFTHEHALHRSTRRLWSWRDEFGAEHEWSAWIGNVAARVGGEGLWSFLTAADKPGLPLGA